LCRGLAALYERRGNLRLQAATLTGICHEVQLQSAGGIPDRSRHYRSWLRHFVFSCFAHFRELVSSELSSAYRRSDADFGFEELVVK